MNHPIKIKFYLFLQILLVVTRRIFVWSSSLFVWDSCQIRPKSFSILNLRLFLIVSLTNVWLSLITKHMLQFVKKERKKKHMLQVLQAILSFGMYHPRNLQGFSSHFYVSHLKHQNHGLVLFEKTKPKVLRLDVLYPILENDKIWL